MVTLMCVAIVLAMVTYFAGGRLAKENPAGGRWRWLHALSEIVGIWLLWGLILATLLQVIVRFVSFSGITAAWSTEGARWFLVWLVFWGSVQLQFDDDHIRIDLLTSHMKGRLSLVQQVVQLVIVVVCCGFLFYAAVTNIGLEFELSTASLGWPVASFGLAAVVGFGLMFIGTLGNIRRVGMRLVDVHTGSSKLWSGEG